MDELVLYSSGKVDKDQGEFVVSCLNLHTGAHVASFKQISTPKNGLDVYGDRIVSVQYQKSLIHVYQLGKETVELKIVSPERLTCVRVSPKGTYLAAGAESGRVLIWELSSGNLIKASDAHYQAVTCIDFTKDEVFVFSASEDSRVLGWNMSEVCKVSSWKQVSGPVFEWTDHSLAITGLVVGQGDYSEARVFTCSLDNTVKCWDINSNSLLNTFVLPSKVHSLAVDPMERAVYAGMENGDIQIVHLYGKSAISGLMESLTGGQRTITLDMAQESYKDSVMAQHQAPVEALALSFDCMTLVSGDQSGQVFSWDVPSRQTIHKLKQHRTAISAIRILHDRTPGLAVPQLKRVHSEEDRLIDDVIVQIPGREFVPDGSDEAVKAVGNESADLKEKIRKLEAEKEALEKNYAQLKGMHDDLWKLHSATIK